MAQKAGQNMNRQAKAGKQAAQQEAQRFYEFGRELGVSPNLQATNIPGRQAYQTGQAGKAQKARMKNNQGNNPAR